jgi:hypothetical protein
MCPQQDLFSFEQSISYLPQIIFLLLHQDDAPVRQYYYCAVAIALFTKIKYQGETNGGFRSFGSAPFHKP